MSNEPGKIICGERELPIPEMLERANRAAHGLRELGIERDDALAVLLRNDFPFFEAAYAANRLGAHLVPINWHFSGPEVAYILEDSGAKAPVAHADLRTDPRADSDVGARVLGGDTAGNAAAYSIADARRRGRAGDVGESWLAQFERFHPKRSRRPAA
jgi:long-chain acyl-CoA synthetase